MCQVPKLRSLKGFATWEKNGVQEVSANKTASGLAFLRLDNRLGLFDFLGVSDGAKQGGINFQGR